jgi:TonB family protein
LDVGGNITSVSVVSSSGNNSLDQAAVNAAYAVGSYPNPTGQTVTANTTVTFALN